jgi:hypothetical protein
MVVHQEDTAAFYNYNIFLLMRRLQPGGGAGIFTLPYVHLSTFFSFLTFTCLATIPSLYFRYFCLIRDSWNHGCAKRRRNKVFLAVAWQKISMLVQFAIVHISIPVKSRRFRNAVLKMNFIYVNTERKINCYRRCGR